MEATPGAPPGPPSLCPCHLRGFGCTEGPSQPKDGFYLLSFVVVPELIKLYVVIPAFKLLQRKLNSRSKSAIALAKLLFR